MDVGELKVAKYHYCKYITFTLTFKR